MSKILCITCRNARRVPSKELASEAWHGCAIFPILERERNTGIDPEMVVAQIICDEAATGWVDLRARPDGESSGITSNNQLLIKGVIRCRYYENN